jgi:hypothetical protein
MIGNTLIESSLGENVGAVDPIASYIDTMVDLKNDTYQYKLEAKASADTASQKAQDVLGLTAEASINNAVGIPSVGVSVTQDGDHKKMSFSFENLKGDPGRDYGEVFVTPEMFGAVGDGVADDTEAIQETLNSQKPIWLNGIYKITDVVNADSVFIKGSNNAELLFADRTGGGEFGFILSGTSYLENVHFHLAVSKKLMKIVNTVETTIFNCNFTSESDLTAGGFIDAYSNNQGLKIIGINYELHTSTNGGIWVREYDSSKTTNDVLIEGCTIKQHTTDEVMAIYGWNGTVKNVTVSNCYIEKLSGSYNSSHFITVGLEGNGIAENVTFEGCNFIIRKITGACFISRTAYSKNVKIIDCNIKVDIDSDLSNGLLYDFKDLRVSGCTFDFNYKMYLNNNARTIISGCFFTSTSMITLGSGQVFDSVFIMYTGGEPDSLTGYFVEEATVGLYNCEFYNVYSNYFVHFSAIRSYDMRFVMRDCYVHGKFKNALFNVYMNSTTKTNTVDMEVVGNRFNFTPGSNVNYITVTGTSTQHLEGEFKNNKFSTSSAGTINVLDVSGNVTNYTLINIR